MLDCSWREGAFPDDCGFTIYNPLGEVVYSCEAPNAQNLGGVFATFLNSCNSNVPNIPLDLAAEELGDKIKLSWTNPSTDIEDNSLSDLSSIIIKRNNKVIHKIDNPTVGQEMTWTDEDFPIDGGYKYCVYATNNGGNGLPGFTSGIVGDACNIRIEMFDGYGDGWYGNSAIKIYYEDYLITTSKLYGGNHGIDTIAVPKGQIRFEWERGPQDYECSFKIYNNQDITIFEHEMGEFIAPGEFYSFENTCADATMANVSGVVRNKETGNVISNVEIKFDGPLTPVVTSDENGEFELEVIANEPYTITASEVYYNLYSEEHTFTEGDNSLTIEMVPFECPNSTNVNAEIISENEIKVSWLNHAKISIEVHDVWEDGSGYQMLLDPTATAYGTIIPEEGPLTTYGDAPQEIYDYFEYKIPANADGNLNTENVLVDGIEELMIPAGTYDWCITNPVPNDRVWIASSFCDPGRFDDYVFKSGRHYRFTVRLENFSDCVKITIEDIGKARLENSYNVYRNNELIASNITDTDYIDEFDFIEGEDYCYTIETICVSGSTSEISEEACVTFSSNINDSNNNFDIYPNPANNVVKISGQNIHKVIVYNTISEKVVEQIIDDNIATIDLTNIPSGAYILKVIDINNNITTNKLIITK